MKYLSSKAFDFWNLRISFHHNLSFILKFDAPWESNKNIQSIKSRNFTKEYNRNKFA